MDAGCYTQMAANEDQHWWFVGTRDVVCSLLARSVAGGCHGQRVLDLGCGTGYTLTRLAELGFDVVGADASADALTHARSRGIGEVDEVDARSLPYANASFDAAVCLDVLEHIVEHEQVARELWRLLKPGAPAVITVPAWRFLFGPHDKALGHVRRYHKAELRALLLKAGFQIEKLSFYNAYLALPIVLVRLLARLRSTSPATDVKLPPFAINFVLRQLLRGEQLVLQRGSFPFGISLVAIVRRPQLS